MVVLGISVYSHYHGYLFFYEAKLGGLMTPSAMSVFIGLALMVISIFGFFGSLKLSTCMVNVVCIRIFGLRYLVFTSNVGMKNNIGRKNVTNYYYFLCSFML